MEKYFLEVTTLSEVDLKRARRRCKLVWKGDNYTEGFGKFIEAISDILTVDARLLENDKRLVHVYRVEYLYP